MRKIRSWSSAVAVIAAITLSACCGSGYVRADALDTVVKVVADRHDNYVMLDPQLTESQRKTYLRSTELLKKVLAEAQE